MKILILGNSGSGKSTLAHNLNIKTKIPVFFLDQLFLNDDYKHKNIEEIALIQNEIFKSDKWIIEGKFLELIDDRIAQADVIIYIKASLAKHISNVIKRYLYQFTNKKIHGMKGGYFKITRLILLIKNIIYFEKNSSKIIISKIKSSKNKIFFLTSSKELDEIINKIAALHK